ncbi:hypothetical protein K4039_00830 [Lyngbya sp. CCAP 1446/10]|nr:hypothetical protein [Lyngbya sp. CCAP 1446/10]
MHRHRYQPFNHLMGKLTEYFAFPHVNNVLRDVYGMEPKVLSAVGGRCDRTRPNQSYGPRVPTTLLAEFRT